MPENGAHGSPNGGANGNGGHSNGSLALRSGDNGYVPKFRRRSRAAEHKALETLPEAQGDYVVLRRDMLFRRALAAADVTAALAATVLTVLIIGPSAAMPGPGLLLLMPLLIVASKAAGLYDRDEHLLRKTTLDEVPALFNLSVLFSTTVWIGDGYFTSADLSRGGVVVLAAILLPLLCLGRSAVRRIVGTSTPGERVLVVGDAVAAARIHKKLHNTPAVNATVIGRVPLWDDDSPEWGVVPVVGELDNLGVTLANYAIERVVIAPGGSNSDHILDCIRLVKALGVKVSVLPRLLEVVGSSAAYDEIDGITLLGVRRYGLTKSSEFLKRAMDVTVSTLALLLLGPMMLTIAVAIKLTSRGSIFFRQPRIGRSGREFRIFKFRSMVDGADDFKPQLIERNETEGLFKIADDPRITTVGRLLRRTSLDELPQLLNVLRGDMSLVGPRPLVPDEDQKIEGWQRRRLLVQPGMTGLWQIFGSSRIPMQDMVKIDYLYGANWSLWLDMKILLRTVPYVFARRGM